MFLLMESKFSVTPIETPVQCLLSRERKDQLLQYNLDQSLLIKRFKFSGNFAKDASADYDQLMKELFINPEFMGMLSMQGSATLPVEYEAKALSATVMTMDFFSKLNESGIVGPGGKIKGCFDEVYDGITVGDTLREVLMNEDSENSYVFAESSKNELLYIIFKMMVMGGYLCQPDDHIERYLELTKDLYKELVTIYKDSKTEEIIIAGRIFQIEKVIGIELFPQNTSSPLNVFLIMIDPLKKIITVLKNNPKPFW